MSRIGILGGTFDPPHNAHTTMASQAMERIPLEKVLFMPAPRPPHKQIEDLTPYEMRRAMVEAAIASEPRFELSRLEEEREGPSYTIDLLDSLTARSDDELYLILGADSVADLSAWRHPGRILELATLVVFPRTGYSPVVPVDGDLSVILFEEPVIDVSSSEIRQAWRGGHSKHKLIADPVRQFILDNSLYS